MNFTSEYILFPLGNQEVQIRYYGIIVVTAMLVAAWMAARLAKRNGADPDHIWGALTWGIFPGLVLARLWFVLFPPITSVEVGRDTAWFLQNFFNTTNGAIAIWSGGLSIFGAVIGGFLGLWLYFGPLHNRVALFFHYVFLPFAAVWEGLVWVVKLVWAKIRGQETPVFALPKFETTFPNEGIPLLPWLDIAGVVLPLAQAIGRWANYVNQELYGTVTTLPWGIPIDADRRVGIYKSPVDYPVSGDNQALFHPLFLYEAIWNLIAFFVLLNLYNRNRDKFSTGDFFLMYLAQYSFIRFLLEFLRVEQAFVPGTAINSSQAFTVVVFVIAVGLLVMRRGKAQQPASEAI